MPLFVLAEVLTAQQFVCVSVTRTLSVQGQDADLLLKFQRDGIKSVFHECSRLFRTQCREGRDLNVNQKITAKW